MDIGSIVSYAMQNSKGSGSGGVQDQNFGKNLNDMINKFVNSQLSAAGINVSNNQPVNRTRTQPTHKNDPNNFFGSTNPFSVFNKFGPGGAFDQKFNKFNGNNQTKQDSGSDSGSDSGASSDPSSEPSSDHNPTPKSSGRKTVRARARILKHNIPQAEQAPSPAPNLVPSPVPSPIPNQARRGRPKKAPVVQVEQVEQINQEPKQRVRSSKNELYEKKQLEIVEKLNKILYLDDENNYIYLYDFEGDCEIRERLEELVPEVKKYFSTHTWGFFKSKIEEKNYWLLCKNIYAHTGYDVISKQSSIVRDGMKKSTMKYTIGKFGIKN